MWIFVGLLIFFSFFFFCFLVDYLETHVPGSTLYGFRGGPAGIMKCKYVELDSKFIYPYRNQVRLSLVCSTIFLLN